MRLVYLALITFYSQFLIGQDTIIMHDDHVKIVDILNIKLDVVTFYTDHQALDSINRIDIKEINFKHSYSPVNTRPSDQTLKPLNAIKINTLSTIIGVLNIDYTRVISPILQLEGGLYFGNEDGLFGTNSSYTFAANLQLSNFLKREATNEALKSFRGAFARGKVGFHNQKFPRSKLTSKLASLGLEIGTYINSKDIWVIEPYFGVHYYLTLASDPEESDSAYGFPSYVGALSVEDNAYLTVGIKLGLLF